MPEYDQFLYYISSKFNCLNSFDTTCKPTSIES